MSSQHISNDLSVRAQLPWHDFCLDSLVNLQGIHIKICYGVCRPRSTNICVGSKFTLWPHYKYKGLVNLQAISDLIIISANKRHINFSQQTSSLTLCVCRSLHSLLWELDWVMLYCLLCDVGILVQREFANVVRENHSTTALSSESTTYSTNTASTLCYRWVDVA